MLLFLKSGLRRLHGHDQRAGDGRRPVRLERRRSPCAATTGNVIAGPLPTRIFNDASGDVQLHDDATPSACRWLGGLLGGTQMEKSCTSSSPVPSTCTLLRWARPSRSSTRPPPAAWFKLGGSGSKNYDESGVKVKHGQKLSEGASRSAPRARARFCASRRRCSRSFTLSTCRSSSTPRALNNAAVTATVGRGRHVPGYRVDGAAPRPLSVAEYALLVKGGVSTGRRRLVDRSTRSRAPTWTAEPGARLREGQGRRPGA
jgi:hypothetical protein